LSVTLLTCLTVLAFFFLTLPPRNGLTGSTSSTRAYNTGVTGSTSCSGASGSTSCSKASSASRPMGSTGCSGDSGASEATGASSATGRTGASGASGTTGANGANNAMEASGASGATGVSGARGATGPTRAMRPSFNAYLYVSVTGTGIGPVADNNSIPMTQYSPTSSRITWSTNTTTIINAGIYYITFFGQSTNNTALGLSINGATPTFQYVLGMSETDDATSTIVIIQLASNSTVALNNVSRGNTTICSKFDSFYDNYEN
jgi:hypothetical protein